MRKDLGVCSKQLVSSLEVATKLQYTQWSNNCRHKCLAFLSTNSQFNRWVNTETERNVNPHFKTQCAASIMHLESLVAKVYL